MHLHTVTEDLEDLLSYFHGLVQPNSVNTEEPSSSGFTDLNRIPVTPLHKSPETEPDKSLNSTIFDSSCHHNERQTVLQKCGDVKVGSERGLHSYHANETVGDHFLARSSSRDSDYSDNYKQPEKELNQKSYASEEIKTSQP